MLKLCGFAASNYYSKVKLALLEKGIAFEEQLVWPYSGAELLANSPLGKLPYMVTEQGSLCESQVLAEYVEAAFPEPRLMPAEPFAAAKIREVITFLEWHLEMVGRELLGMAFFGVPENEEAKQRVEKTLTKNMAAFVRLAKFEPFLCSPAFSLADCAATVHFSILKRMTEKMFARDMLQEAFAAQGRAGEYEDYLKLLHSRPTVQKTMAESRENLVALIAYRKAMAQAAAEKAEKAEKA